MVSAFPCCNAETAAGSSSWGAIALRKSAGGLGWAIAVVATFLISHAELFGLRQVYLNLKRCPEPSAGLVETGLYRLVRHPLRAWNQM